MNSQRKSPLTVRLGGTELKIYRIGGTPHIKRLHLSEADPGTLKGIHTHFTYEIFFVTQGILKLVTEDFTNTYQNSVVIIPPRLKHFSFPDTEGCFCLLFSRETQKGSKVDRYSTGSERAALSLTMDRILEIPLSDDMAFYIRKLADKSKENTAEAERDCQFLASLLFHEVFSLLSVHTAQSDTQTQSHHFRDISETSRTHMDAIETFINFNLRQKITLADVAAHVYLSPKQTSRIIKREYGTGFSQLVSDKRMAAAEILLKNTDMKISEIAQETFPGTEAYFYTLFQKTYGLSPLQYRKRERR